MSFPRRALRSFGIAAVLLLLAPPGVGAQDTSPILGDDPATRQGTGQTIRPVRTESPRDTLATFIRLRGEVEQALRDYRENRSTEVADHMYLLGEQLHALIDLSKVPRSSRREVGNETALLLLDIFGRVGLPNLDDVPNEEAFDLDGPANYRIPRTPIRITRIDLGPRDGEFLFNSRTVGIAPRFYQGIKSLPLRSDLGIRNWTQSVPQLTGPLIPSRLVSAVPTGMRSLWLGTPIWKVAASIASALIAGLLIAGLHRWLARREPSSRIGVLSWQLLRPLSILLVVALLNPFIDDQINVFGQFARVVDGAMTLLIYFSAAWIFWLGARLFFEWLILSPSIPEEGLDANLLRLLAGLIGVIGITIIVAYSAQELGLPVLSVLAGLGIGGLAVALAIRPTLENLIGGIILFLDRPVRVGDFCDFGSKRGTVETIGIRSTQLRALDRTLITVPNAQFADMQIVNWAQCDEMLIDETIGLRYETKADQLRYFLARLRETLHAHPRITSETVRVRFSGYGDSSLNVRIRVYAKTTEWNDFYAIREDIFLRLFDLVEEAGTSFAFPSRTLYLGKDEGLDKETGDKAAAQVQAWRRSGRLPFPRFNPEKLEKLDGTLDYPPKGSHEAGHEELETDGGSERLSARPRQEREHTEAPGSVEAGNKRRTDED